MDQEREAALPSAATAQQMLDFELAVLRALPGVNSVADFPAGGIASLKLNSPNDNGVRLRLGRQLVKQTFKADISDKLQAARVLKDRMKGDSFVGEAAVLAVLKSRCGVVLNHLGSRHQQRSQRPSWSGSPTGTTSSPSRIK